MPPPPSNGESSFKKQGREDAIETLIDMDPCGAAYRVARTMNGALASTLHGRSNRIPDAALFDAAHSLTKYEITPQSPEVLDLYAHEGCGDSTDEVVATEETQMALTVAASDEKDGDEEVKTAEQPPTTTAATPELKEGWQTRVLRHHDKIVRAKNNANPTGTSNLPMGKMGKPSSTPKASNNAIPPPALLSALRQIFGSSSPSDLQELSSKGGISDDVVTEGLQSKEGVNTLSSLLQVVLNHGIFTGTASTLPTNETIGKPKAKTPIRTQSDAPRSSLDIKRDWKSMFDISANDSTGGEDTNDEEEEGDAGSQGENSCATSSQVGEEDDDVDTGGMGDNTDLRGGGGDSKSNVAECGCVPSAANLESILGNATRDMLHQSGSENSRVHGLLIAALSVMTGCLLDEDDLENLNLGEAKDVAVPPAVTLDSTNDASDPFAYLLQVGALLSVLSNKGKGSTSDISDEMKDFALDPKLLHYFVDASSTYEERIEIQKANLFKSSQPSPTLVKRGTSAPATCTSAVGKDNQRSGSPSISSLLGSNTSPLDSIPSSRAMVDDGGEVSGSDANDDTEILPVASAISGSSLPDLIPRVLSNSSNQSEESGGDDSDGDNGETAASILLGTISNMVANEMAAAEEEDEMHDILGEDHDNDDNDGDIDHDSVDDMDEADILLEAGSVGEMLMHSDDESDSNDESMSDHDHEEMEEAAEEGNEEEDEAEGDDEENEEEENEEDEDDEAEELQRALALSLAAAIDGSSSDSSNSSDGSDATTTTQGNAGAPGTRAAAAIAAADAIAASAAAIATTPPTETTPPPPPGGKAEMIRIQKRDEGENLISDLAPVSIPLPPLPAPPPFFLLPKHQARFGETPAHGEGSEGVETAAEGAKSNAEGDLSAVAVFEPSALSSFGKLPASHVLVHLLRAVLGLLQGCNGKEQSATDIGSSDGAEKLSDKQKPSSTVADKQSGDTISSRFFAPNKKRPSSLKKRDDKDDKEKADEDEAITTAKKGQAFAPDSTTASLLIASLHLSSHLRNSAMAVLTDLLFDDSEDRKHDGAVVDDKNIDNCDDDDSGSGQSIQIANSAIESVEDPDLPEKDDPASGIAFAIATDEGVTTSECLETKGLKRKAAAAAQIASLRQKSKQRLVQMWTRRVEFYSACCLLNLRCLSMFMGKCVGTLERQAPGVVSMSTEAVSMSTKTRLGVLAILSNFYSSASSVSCQALQVLMRQFQGDTVLVEEQYLDRFLVVPLCNESLHLWGAAIPLFYPDHVARVEFLRVMLLPLSMASTAAGSGKSRPSAVMVAEGRIRTCPWTDAELQGSKLDVFCKRLRVSDMLDCFVAPPMISDLSVVQLGVTPDNSLSTISLLSDVVMEISSRGKNNNLDSNLTKFYLALCQRAISNLILWDNLFMSSNDANDHDISGGEATGSPSGAGSWADGSLQLQANPAKFHFDPTKCADSISVAPSPQQPPQPAITANQRATKVWGTVLSTTFFLPKTGVHRWAVKLDKCERGHVFVGVSTSRANLKTYVGGDSNGWGLIGTQALWHDRNKIRGDYGNTFRTGAVVVITLDTNVGTLSFGLWKDAAASPAASEGGSATAPLSPMALMASPRRGNAPVTGGPVIEDWGIAFEGLPLDVKLYPAVGLYQRDDRATLYSVSNDSMAASSGKSSLSSISSGDIYFPLAKDQNHFSCVRAWNQKLCSDGISFATGLISRSINLLSSTDAPSVEDDILLTEILPSLASSICLIPSCIPTLSAKYAMELLPLVTRCAKLIDKIILASEGSVNNSVGVVMVEGEWLIHIDAKSSEGDNKSSDDSAEYSVCLKHKVLDDEEPGYSCYYGESVNAGARSPNKYFSVIGASYGTRIQIVEEWCSSSSGKEGDLSFDACSLRSTSSFVIDARLSLDGTKFEGIRHNVQKGSAERIIGSLQKPSRSEAVAVRKSRVTRGEEEEVHPNRVNQWIQTESLLCLAVGHLSLILCSQTSLSDIDNDADITETRETCESLLSTSPILSRGRLDHDGIHVRRAIDSVWERCRSAETSGLDIVEQWQDSIYFDLFSATDASSTEDAIQTKEAVGIIERHSSTMEDQKGSLSRLSPAEYTLSQSVVASAIFYHTRNLRNDGERQVQLSELVSRALQVSRQILENGIRDALLRAEAGVPHKEVCANRCYISGLIAQFLFEFSCTPGSSLSSMPQVIDDISLVFKSIKSEEDLEYIKQLLNAKTEKSIMRYVGLRSLHLLLQSEGSLEGIQVHSATEAALVSLPRLLRPPATTVVTTPSELDPNQCLIAHLTSSVAGCAASVQTCIHSCVRSLYGKIGSILTTPANQESTSLVLGLLANYFTVFHANEYDDTMLKMLPSLRNIVDLRRDWALGPAIEDAESSSEKLLLNIVRKQENQRLLRTSASVLLTSCSQLSKESGGSPHLVELLSEHLLQEITKTISFVVEKTKLIRDNEEVEAIISDWAMNNSPHGSKLPPKHSNDKGTHSSKGLAYLSNHGTLSMKPAVSFPESSSTIYLSQLLNVLHDALIAQPFIESIKNRAGAFLSALGLQPTDGEQIASGSLNGLPLKFRRRILRLLRPLLLSMDADALVSRQLFHIAGSIAEVSWLDDKNGICSNDELLFAQDAVSLLRYLYTFSKSWREVIHQNVDDVLPTWNSSPSLSCGILTFFGGAPGNLQPGSFVVIEPEVRAPSSTTVGSTKSRNGNSLTGSASNASSGSGTEEIVAGLCRHKALSGVLSSIDPRAGNCEVIVLGNKSHVQLPPTMGSDSRLLPSRVTIRAVRVSSANVSAADEFPLVLDDTNLPADIFSPMSDVMKSVSSSIKAHINTQDKETAELDIDANELMKCALGLRSTTVLTSDPTALQKFVTDESSSLQLLLAHALQMASLRTESTEGLSSLPSLEARIWHLLSVRLAVKSRKDTIDNASPASLRSLFEEDKSSSNDVSPKPNPGSKGYRTPPSASAGFFLGSERTSRNTSSREAATNTRREEDGSASAVAAAERNEEEEEESSDTAAAHLREAAIVQMAELGLPRQWAELALSRVGGTNIEAAVHFCLERGGDMERLLAEESERRGPSSFLSSRRRGFGASRMGSSNLIRQLVEMGFPRHWCIEALSATRNNVDEALTWILTNGDRLSAEDEAAEEGQVDEEEENEESEDEEDDNDDDDDDDEEGEGTAENQEKDVEDKPLVDDKPEATSKTLNDDMGWSGICPIRFVSGRSSINPKTLEITGLPNGGFSSVGTKGVLLTSGKWYYEAEIKTAGCLQIGWADSSFVGHCQADRGDGCGDGPSSWAFDGWRRYRWHSTATEWGCKWAEGDIVGCLVDMDSMSIGFTLNGKGEEIGMGPAFSGEGFRPCSGVYACVSFNRREKLRLILGGEGTEPFKHAPPDGYRGIGEAIHDAVKERGILLAQEKVLLDTHSPINDESSTIESKKYICDFSDGEHGHELFAWQHRYYGSDASVHLGSSRPSLFGGSGGSLKTSKSNATSTKNDNQIGADISSRLSKILTKPSKLKSHEEESDSFEASMNLLRDAYLKVDKEVDKELKEVCSSLCVLYSQKLVMHTMVSHSNKFSLLSFLPNVPKTPWSYAEDAELEVSRRLWQVLEHCTSLQSSGWVGEAGAMAVAAEALGLGISAGDNKSNSIPAGMCSVSASNDQVLLLCGGVTQFLSSAVSPEHNLTSTASTFAACSENAIGSDVGGSLSFIRTSLQSAVASSASFRRVLLAAVRRAIRLLAVTEYTSDEGTSEEEDTDLERKRSESNDVAGSAPDARLVSFLTGVLLSEPVSERLSDQDNVALRSGLFEGWCLGLLSASSPWRMVCSLTAASILNMCPQALYHATSRVPTIAKYLGRLESTVLRRTWAERAAVPVCSKYAQALIELLASVKRALRLCPGTSLPSIIKVDAATPLPFNPSSNHVKTETEISECKSWECSEGWVISNTGWEVWTGSVEIMEVEWKAPPRSSVRTLMDGGDGPPLLREGCIVMRGADWNADNEDGKDLYEKDKIEKEEQKRVTEEEEERKTLEHEGEESEETEHAATETAFVDPASEEEDASPSQAKEEPVELEQSDKKTDKPKKKKKKAVASKLPLGIVLSIEPWNGIPAMGRRVRWNLTGNEGIYRYGGDGGRFDILHVETNDKETRVKKKHPPPETHEQCATRYGFGKRRNCNVLLRLRNSCLRNDQSKDTGTSCDGILEWPDFGAGIRVDCKFYPDGAVSITEKEVLYGSKDSGWESRFGQPAFVPGTVMDLSTTRASTGPDDTLAAYDRLLGSNSFLVKNLRNKEDGGNLRVTTEMQLLRCKQNIIDLKPSISFTSSQPPPICFDPDLHASSISLSKDKRSVTCAASDGRGVAFGNVGFTKGVHYWEVKLEKAEIGSVYIGVAEKPGSTSTASQASSFGFESQPRLNRWLGWGFVNFRATYTAGAERVYGAHCHSGDTVGVLLDCDAGRINYFIDGVKYGEHILNDLGCAFENVSPFGFNADGCGSGGAGQGAPSGIDGGRSGRYPANGAVRPKALWPVIGLRHPGDRVTMSSKWMTSHGVDGAAIVGNNLAVDEILCSYERPQMPITPKTSPDSGLTFPPWFVEESFHEYTRWKSGRWLRSSTRGSGPCKLSSYGLDAYLDTSPFACAAASASIGLPIAFLRGDRVDVKRSAGRILELQEEAVVLGTYQGRLFYRLVSQKSEGGSLMEGGGRSWFWDESEAVDGGLQLIGQGLGKSVKLPKLNRFNPQHNGLKVVYVGGAVVRSDLEIFDGSKSMGTIPSGTVIPRKEVIERRMNSCGVVRYLIEHEPIGRGWISSCIRGGKEEAIVEMMPFENEGNSSLDQHQYISPEDSAREWYSNYEKESQSSRHELERNHFSQFLNIDSIQEFRELLIAGVVGGLSQLNSDSLVAATYGKISDVLPDSSEGDCSFLDCALVIGASHPRERGPLMGMSSSIDAIVHEAANESLSHVIDSLPPTKALMARISMLRAFNRRARFGLPWLPLRSAQESSAILGGLSGYGTSLERAGRTWDVKSQSLWVQAPSISSRLRNCREILFTSTKRSFLDSVMDATTTPTPLSHDEYELPREVRTVRVNRLKAHRAMASDDTGTKKKHSVISQLQREMRGWSGATLRRGFVAKGHGGQKRAFKVKLVGEGVNDYSGPYREVFTDAMHEVTDLDPSGNSSLGVLEPSANNQAGAGEGRDLFVFALPPNESMVINHPEKEQYVLSSEERDLLNSFSSITHKKDENSREIEEAISYLGKLVGTACRHGIPVDLPLPLGMVWKRLTEESIDVADILKEIDILASRTVQDEESFSIRSDNVLASQRRLLNSFVEGMSSVLPVELLSMFTGEQLRGIICGNPEIDVELLRRVVEYEGYNECDMVVIYFWEVLREMTTLERKQFLQFVWARNRLPLKESDFDAPFKIQKDTKTVDKDGDYPLPSASTCFFSLTLPEYPEKEMLKQKLLFAIENVTTMESDYVTNDVEVSEGWRGL